MIARLWRVQRFHRLDDQVGAFHNFQINMSGFVFRNVGFKPGKQ